MNIVSSHFFMLAVAADYYQEREAMVLTSYQYFEFQKKNIHINLHLLCFKKGLIARSRGIIFPLFPLVFQQLSRFLC